MSGLGFGTSAFGRFPLGDTFSRGVPVVRSSASPDREVIRRLRLAGRLVSIHTFELSCLPFPFPSLTFPWGNSSDILCGWCWLYCPLAIWREYCTCTSFLDALHSSVVFLTGMWNWVGGFRSDGVTWKLAGGCSTNDFLPV